jgi:hypothetical protein
MKFFGIRTGKHSPPPVEKWARAGRISDLISALSWLGVGGSDSEDELALAVQIYAELALIRIGSSKSEALAKALELASAHVHVEVGLFILTEAKAPTGSIPPGLLELSFNQVAQLVREFGQVVPGGNVSPKSMFVLDRKVRYASRQLERLMTVINKK